MTDIPRAVLSEQFEALMHGRSLHTAVFVTYQFEPAFFEQQVLPVFLDVPVSHAETIRRVQLEEALCSLQGEIAVYYDPNAIVQGDGGSAKLDVRRIPVRHRTGVFHPKNVFLLVEQEEPDDNGERAQSLLVACLSANLTRAGWWENVECAHIEEIEDGSLSRLTPDLLQFLKRLRERTRAKQDQVALTSVLNFLKRKTTSRATKSTNGRLHTHFFGGDEELPEFLERVGGDVLRGAYLEVISPFFDDAAESAPLHALIERLAPKEVRVFLPRTNSGEAQVNESLYKSVRELPGVSWGRLPDNVIGVSKHGNTQIRSVHAKVYRFFTQNPKREVCFVGSANLTRSAHSKGGNWETGFLVDGVPQRRPEFWMSPDTKSPVAFEVRHEDEPTTTEGGSCLSLVYKWNRSIALAYWDNPDQSNVLVLSARGTELGEIRRLDPQQWVTLPREMSERIRSALTDTSLFEVRGERPEPVPLLVQEEGMYDKPSLLLELSAADILHYWALLSPAQRAAFVEARASELALSEEGADLVAKVAKARSSETVFDRFAGIFHAFRCLEQELAKSIQEGRLNEADYRLFGRKYDSLGTLLERLSANSDSEQDVGNYVMKLCADQLLDEVGGSFPDYWAERRREVQKLRQSLAALSGVRRRLINSDSDTEKMSAYLDWFDKWFLQRAKPSAETDE